MLPAKDPKKISLQNVEKTSENQKAEENNLAELFANAIYKKWTEAKLTKLNKK